MPITYEKPYKSIAEQLDLLRNRGMSISDPASALQFLEYVGYYRLSGYWYPLRKRALRDTETGRGSMEVLDEFLPGTDFKHVVDLYTFDRSLRLLLLDAIERIEVAVRVAIALMIGKRDPWAHRDPTQVHGSFAGKPPGQFSTLHENWIAALDKRAKDSKEEFVKHFVAKYTQPLPIWVAIEVWDFGLLSTFVDGMKNADVTALAESYSIPRAELLMSWIRALNLVRNICAHHSRLWNKPLVNQPKVPRSGEMPLHQHWINDLDAKTRLYSAACVIQHLLVKINPSSTWAERLKLHMGKLPVVPGVKLRQSGFPEGWQNQKLWQKIVTTT